ncbi:MAG: phosphohydrolase [Desulforhopalus sp.]
MKCPGQDMKYWKDDAIFDADCPKCGTSIEFYKDDTTRKCSHCDHRFVNPKMDFGCASYCQFAEQCLGTLPEEFMGSREDLLKDKVAVAMKRHFQTDFTSIRKATNAARHAENIGKEEGGNLAVILCAAYLHGVGIENARTILQKVGAGEQLVLEICTLLSSQTEVPPDAPLQNKIIHDALTINQFQDDLKDQQITIESFRQLIDEKLMTSAGKVIATDLYRK